MKVLIVLFVALGLALAPSLLMTQQSPSALDSQMVALQEKEKPAQMDMDKKDAGKSMKGDEEAVKRHEEWAKKANEWNVSLNEKVEAMNSAPPDQKVAAMAAVINEMASQRNQMFERFKEFHGKRHGGMASMKGEEGMGCSGCPGMEGMHGKMRGKMESDTGAMESDTGAADMERARESGISDPGCPNLNQDVPIGSNYYDHGMGLSLNQRP